MITFADVDNLSLHAEQVQESLPVLRRWLVRSGPVTRGILGDGLSLSHLRVLVHLFYAGPQTMSELAYGLGISCSTVTECVSVLESKARVTRTRSTSDRRRVMVSLTAQAEAVASQVFTHRREVIDHALNQLTSQERKAFVKGLTILAESAESWVARANSAKQEDLVPA